VSERLRFAAEYDPWGEGESPRYVKQRPAASNCRRSALYGHMVRAGAGSGQMGAVERGGAEIDGGRFASRRRSLLPGGDTAESAPVPELRAFHGCGCSAILTEESRGECTS
jgi:hypothetical protein